MPLTRRGFVAGLAGVATTLGATGSSSARSPRQVVDHLTQPADGGLRPAVRFFESRRATVALFGDSIVTGLGLADPTDRWADRLQASLRRDSYTALMTVDNRGVGGQSIISERPFSRTDRSHADTVGGGGEIRAREHAESYPEVIIGGRLVDHVPLTIPPPGTPTVPRIVVVQPSVNELIVSQKPTADERVDYAIAGLRFVRDYLVHAGVRTIFFLPMVVPTKAFDDATSRQSIEETTLFNSRLAAAGMLTPVDYGLGRVGLEGSDPVWFDDGYDGRNDGLHPGPLGHARIADAMFRLLREFAIRL